MDILSMSVLWWHWIVFGIFLLILEMNTGTFIMLGLGVAAVVVGVVDTFLQTSFLIEISIWMVVSILFIAIWYLWFRDTSPNGSGQSDHRLETMGTVIEEIKAHGRGKVLFDTPVLGDTKWYATSSMDTAKGSRVGIVQVSGQLIEVEKI